MSAHGDLPHRKTGDWSTAVVGAAFDVPYPFVRDTYNQIDGDGEGVSVQEMPTWKPGVRNEDEGEGNVTSYADALGRMVLTVVSTHRPKGFPLRVFFTRTWVSPDGKAFGKNRCRITTAGAFRALTRGYQHAYVLKGCTCDGCEWPYEDHRLKGHRAWESEVIDDEPQPDAVAVDPHAEPHVKPDTRAGKSL